jgi:hypothetical protein
MLTACAKGEDAVKASGAGWHKDCLVEYTCL